MKTVITGVLGLFLIFLSSCTLPQDGIPHLDGKKNGKISSHFPNGKIKEMMNYRQGRLNGPGAGYYPDGKIHWTVPFKEGKRHGIQRVYYQNGSLYSQSTFINNVLQGEVKKYRPDGRLEYRIPVRDGKISGKVIRYTYGRKLPQREPVKRKSTPRKDPTYLSEGHMIWDSPVIMPDEPKAVRKIPDSVIPLLPPFEKTDKDDRPVTRLPENEIKLKDDRPGDGFHGDEGWKQKMLESGKDYEQVILEGI